MAERNAKALFSREQDERSLREKMLLDLQESLQLVRFPRCIECIDTSNISGTDPVASLCAFVNGERDKSRTRLFRIKSTKTSDDYSSMREVLHRHFASEKTKGPFLRSSDRRRRQGPAQLRTGRFSRAWHRFDRSDRLDKRGRTA